jgi:repressor LexA
MTTQALTDRQQEVLNFLGQYLREKGYPPTVREIGAHLGIRSPNGVAANLVALEKKGIIARDKNVARGIRITEWWAS